MKTLLIAVILLFTAGTIQAEENKPKPKHKAGYNYKAHGKRNAKHKSNNERGHYMKCNRK